MVACSLDNTREFSHNLENIKDRDFILFKTKWFINEGIIDNNIEKRQFQLSKGE